MPRLWDRSRRERRTPFSDLLADYLEAHKWMRPKHLASDTGLSATTIQRYLNGEVVPHDPRILQQISAGTGIPLNQLYEAAGLWLPGPPSPPQPLDDEHEPRHRPARRVSSPRPERDPAYIALKGFLRSLQAQPMPDAVRQAIIDSYLDSLRPLYPQMPSQPIISAWREQLWNEEHDHNFIETLELQALPAPTPAPAPTHTAAAADEQQPESQPAGRC